MLVVLEDFTPLREGTVALADGRRLGWAEFGDPAGTPLVWCHGTPGGRRQLPPDAPAAALARGVRFIGFDRPGTGRSTPHVYGCVADVVADVATLLDHLGLDRVTVGGLSGGGPYALALAWGLPTRVVAAAVLGGVGPTRGPETAPGLPRLLVPIEPMLRVAAGPLGRLVTVAARPLLPWADALFGLYARFGPAADRPALVQPDLQAVLLHDLASSLEGGLQAPFGDLVAFARDWGFSLQDIHVPVTFWHGDADAIVPFVHGSHQAGLVPAGRLVVCPERGHFAGFELIDAVLEDLLARAAEASEGTHRSSRAPLRGDAATADLGLGPTPPPVGWA